METFSQKIILIFFTSLGTVIGASILGSLAAVFADVPPFRTMVRIANDIKIWAIVAAIGGTFSTIEILGSGIFDWEIRAAVKQLLFIVFSYMGASVGQWLILSLAGGK
ncbi:MAG: YtrH family sporulation protein [Desulfitobacteriaceae bacterium]|nr:YtrH family sporulation protein [Desulfitobacteriaceae bacterium]MDD4752446.1 YtrH family sporulation protein [Desulfitobacteriaceae bacterium]